MIDGDLPHVITDARVHPGVKDLTVTRAAEIGSYIGVPVHLSDGRLYGTLCGISHAPTTSLGGREVELMRFLAELLAERVEHEQADARRRRVESELAGIRALIAALEARDHYTGEHSRRVVELATDVAQRLGLDEEQVLEVEQVALLHDIGKVGIPDAILQKHGALNDQEWELMRQHPALGARILSSTSSLAHLAPAVRAEHERWDGTGYPDGIGRAEIPIASRITLACDAYHAMTSDRPYRSALRPEWALAELQANSGTQFDPEVVLALTHILGSDGER
jgi:HD-GYP domain-containing protein (c-di-GMP phosphodiesterase class II)